MYCADVPAVDAFNFGVGLRRLEPGETWTASPGLAAGRLLTPRGSTSTARLNPARLGLVGQKVADFRRAVEVGGFCGARSRAGLSRAAEVGNFWPTSPKRAGLSRPVEVDPRG